MSLPNNADEARVQGVVAAMPALTDNGAWDRLRLLFDDKVVVDYTSLWGGEAEELDGDELMRRWRGLVPGFDATRHQLGPVDARIERDEATAKAEIKAIHFLGGEAWVVEGRYDVRLTRRNGGWRISALTLSAQGEQGDRSLVKQAQEAAA